MCDRNSKSIPRASIEIRYNVSVLAPPAAHRTPAARPRFLHAGHTSTANFQLKHSLVQLEAIVVTGYGTQAKRDVTGAVGQVQAEQIKQIPTTNAIEAIKGRIPGVDIVTTGYKPGDGVRVRVRGQRSLKASNDPLYVLDGIPMA